MLGELENLGVVLGKVSDNGVGDLGNVEESVAVGDQIAVRHRTKVATTHIKSMDQ